MGMPTLQSRMTACFATAACVFSLLPIRAAEPGQAGDSAGSPSGTLQIVGKGIQQLVLVDTTGRELRLDRPGPSVSVPAGTYYVKQTFLQGGFKDSGSARNLFTITPSRDCRLVVGGPLTSTVTVKRCGSVLKIDYALLGVDECKYARDDYSDPPRFTVYQGDREIGSGKFDYG